MKKAVFLFDTTGYAAAPFTELGWHTTIIDILNTGRNSENTKASCVLDWNILEKESEIIELTQGASLLFGFPPCTDLAVSGAAHFAKKRKLNPNFQQEAVNLALSVERIGNATNTPWAFENPVSCLSTLYRKPCFTFEPWYYGGWLPEDDQHPDYPRYIAPRDAYPKTTKLWTGNGFKMPERKYVRVEPGYSRQHRLLGGKSEKTKRIRSASPRGFFIALAAMLNDLGEL